MKEEKEKNLSTEAELPKDSSKDMVMNYLKYFENLIREHERLKTAKQIFDDLDEIFYPNTMSYDDEKYQELKKKWSNP